MKKEGFGRPGLGSPQLTSCLRVKWVQRILLTSYKKMKHEDIVECQNINNVNSEEKSGLAKTIKKKVQWDPGNYKAIFY